MPTLNRNRRRDPGRTRLFVRTALCTIAVFCGWEGSTLAHPVCEHVREVRAGWVASQQGVQGRGRTLERAVNGALREAVREAVGVEVGKFSSNSSSTAVTVTDRRNRAQFSERMRSLAFEKASGFILSYKIATLKWDNKEDGRNAVHVSVLARVCVPVPGSLPYIVTFTPFRWANGRRNSEATNLAEAALPPSRRFILLRNLRNSDYRDIVIGGMIFKPHTYRVSRANEIAVLSRYLGRSSLTGVNSVVRRMSLTLTVSARFVEQHRTVVQTVRVSGTLPSGEGRAYAKRKLLRQAVESAMPQLMRKVEAVEGN